MAGGIETDVILPSIVADSEKIAETAATIALLNFEWRHLTLVFFNSALMCGIDIFVKLYGKNVAVSKGDFHLKFNETKQFVVFGTGIQDIVNMLQMMQKHGFVNTGKFVVICQSLKGHYCDNTEAMKIFWNYKISNIVFFTNADENNKVTGYTLELKENCVSSQVVKLKGLDACAKTDIKHCRHMFPVKFMNLQKCPIIVSVVEQPPYMMLRNGTPTGINGDLLRIIAKKLNASLNIVIPRNGKGIGGTVSEKGDWDGSLGDIQNGYANFSMIFSALTYNRYICFQVSIAYNFVTLIWITHPTKLLPSSVKLIHPFKENTQIAVSVIFFLVVLSSFFTRSKLWNSFGRRINVPRPRRSIVFYSWMIFLGLPTKKLPVKPAFLCVVVFWIWYTFLIRSYYQAALIGSLKANLYHSKVETVDQMIDEGYSFGGGGNFKEFYNDNPLIYNKWKNLNYSDIYKLMMEISQGSKLALAVNLQYVDMFLQEHPVNLNKLRQQILVSPTMIYFKKYSPLANPVNRVLRRLIEGGFTDNLYKKYCHAQETVQSEDKLTLNLNHFKGCYAILILGWTISTAAFIGEIIRAYLLGRNYFNI